MFAQPKTIQDITWSVNRLGELLESLVDKSGISARPHSLPQPPEMLELAGIESISRWIDAACSQLGIEAESLTTTYADLPKMIRLSGPTILQVPRQEHQQGFDLVGLLHCGKRKATVLTPELKTRRVAIELLRQEISAPLESVLLPQVEPLLSAASVPPERWKKARQAILNDQLGYIPLQAGWMLRLAPGSAIPRLLRKAHLLAPFAAMFTIHFIQQLLILVGWVVIGRGIFQGHFDWGWITAWVIVLLSTIPLGLIVSDMQGEFSLRTGAIFKERLLYGITQLKPDEIRHLGLGQFLGRVMESEAFEMLAFGGGFSALLSFIELGLAVYVFTHGAMGSFLIILLLAWLLIILLMLWNNYIKARDWAQTYREMTNELVENLVGHRTRLAQEDPSHWHDREDQLLNRYLKLSEDLDRAGQQLQSLSGRGWLILGLTTVGLGFVSGSVAIQALAISLGGVLFAFQGLNRLVNGAQSLVNLRIAWDQVAPILKAADRAVETPALDFVAFQPTGSDMVLPPPITVNRLVRLDSSSPSQTASSKQPVMLARDLTFRYRPTARPVINEVSLSISHGDHVLLEGPSGGGKTTLAALLTGLREPESGSLLLWGMDRRIVGSQEWHRRIAMAPQFHENYVFSETLGFNLLMGRRWPATQADLAEAEQLLRVLGLGDVFDKMPSGFQQMLGESGWQLSHGERSRLFIARTLLQNSDLVILDESFGALDAENLKRSLQTVFDRVETLLVIAHP
jgi:ATP-binding cassette, subfamily B, bacterial